MVNADNFAFRQAYYMDGRVGQMNDYSTSVNEIDTRRSRESAFPKIDPAAIGRQIEEAKQAPARRTPSSRSASIRSAKCFRK